MSSFDNSQVGSSSATPQMFEEMLLQGAEQDIENGDEQDAVTLLKAAASLSSGSNQGTGSDYNNNNNYNNNGNNTNGNSSLGSILSQLSELEHQNQLMEKNLHNATGGGYDSAKGDYNNNTGNNGNGMNLGGGYGNNALGNQTGDNNLGNSLANLFGVNNGGNTGSNNANGNSYENPFSNLNSFSGASPMSGQASYDRGFVNGFQAGQSGQSGQNFGFGTSPSTYSNTSNPDFGGDQGPVDPQNEETGNTVQADSFSSSSWGDPHLDATINGNHQLANDTDGSSHSNLINANNSFSGGYQVGTQETPKGNGADGKPVTINSEVDTHLGGKQVAVSTDANGKPSVMVGNEQLQPGGSLSWQQGGSTFSVSQDANGDVHEKADNDNGGHIQTDIGGNDKGGLDETTSGSGVTLGGVEAHRTHS